MSDIPRAISESTMSISGVTLRVYVLDDGRRVIHGDDIAALFAAWAEGASADPADIENVASILREPRT